MAYVRIKNDASEKIVHLKHNISVIGRSPNADIEIPETNAFEHHAEIIYLKESGDYYLKDCATFIGTVFKGKKISDPVVLGNGDSFNIGNVELKFYKKGAKPQIDRFKYELDKQEKKRLLIESQSQRKKMGLIESAVRVLLMPMYFFRTMDFSASFHESLLFFSAVSVGLGLMINSLSPSLRNQPAEIFWIRIFTDSFIFAMIALIFMVSFATTCHLFVMVFMGKGNLKETIAVLCYSSISLLLLRIPYFGVFGFIYFLVLAATGLGLVHRLSTITQIITMLLLVAVPLSAVELFLYFGFNTHISWDLFPYLLRHFEGKYGFNPFPH